MLLGAMNAGAADQCCGAMETANTGASWPLPLCGAKAPQN